MGKDKIKSKAKIDMPRGLGDLWKRGRLTGIPESKGYYFGHGDEGSGS